jgi:hypothetical protein
MKNDVVTVVTMCGEYVGRCFPGCVSECDTTITLSNPRMVLTGEDGSMGFARGVAMTGEENPKTIKFNNFIFVTPTNPEVVSAYVQSTSGIVISSSAL